MPTIFDSSTRGQLRGRLENLSPHSRRRWGSMSPAQAQVHLCSALRMALGTFPVKPLRGPLSLPPVRWLVIHSPLPWPKGAPTAPELIIQKVATWDADRKNLIDALEAVAALGEAHQFAPHPAFGKLSGHSWGVLMWRHIDHHLRQFGL